MSTRHIDIDPNTGHLRIRFEYDAELVRRVKQLSRRRWNPQVRAWFAPAQRIAEVWRALQDQGFTVSNAVRELAQAEDLTFPEPPDPFEHGVAPDGTPRLTPSQLNHRVRDALAQAFPQPMWVVADLSGWRPGRGRSVFFELVEPDAERSGTRAKTSAIILPQARARLDQLLARIGGLDALHDGLRVCMRARVDVYPPSGSYQLIVDDIDPQHTLQHIDDRRKLILDRLRQLELLGLNTALPVPLVPLRVGLITSAGSHASADFLNELALSRLGFQVQLFDAHMQGRFLEETVLAGLAHFADRRDDVDMIAIIRGGGARTDLAWFDTLPLGRAVCEHPVPIIVGIGHHNDRSVLDDAARSFKTPTAAAQGLVRRVSAFIDDLDALQLDLLIASDAALAVAHAQLHATASAVSAQVTQRVAVADADLRAQAERLGDRTRARLKDAALVLGALNQRLPNAAQDRLRRDRGRLDAFDERITPDHLTRPLKRDLVTLDDLQHRLQRAAQRTLDRASDRLDLLDALRRAASPQATLQRGFAIARDLDGALVRSAAQLTPGQRLTLTLGDGHAPVQHTPHHDPDP